MGSQNKRRRIAATAAGGIALGLIALIGTPQAVTAQPLVGAGKLASAVAAGGASAYLEVDGITPAPATPTDHTKDIVLRSLSWKVTNSSTNGTASGGGSGKATFGRFHVTKALDAVTPQLLSATGNGKHIANAHLFLVRTASDGSQLEALEYDLRSVLVVDDEETTDGNGTETVELDARQFTVTLLHRDDSGHTGVVRRAQPELRQRPLVPGIHPAAASVVCG